MVILKEVRARQEIRANLSAAQKSMFEFLKECYGSFSSKSKSSLYYTKYYASNKFFYTVILVGS